MPDFRYAVDADQVPAGKAASVEIDDRWYAICNDGGSFYACDFHCPHEDGPLGEGEVHDGCIVCPVHHWPWDLKTGLSDPNLPHLYLKRYRCELRDGQVHVDVSTPIPRELPENRGEPL